MIRAAQLGLRLAWRAERSRSALIVIGSTLAATLLLTGAGAYGAMQVGPSASDTKRLLLTVAIAVAAPIVVLLITAARLSSSSRERRAAALSRLGLARRNVRSLAGAENAVLATIGALVGICLHVLVAAPLLDVLGRRADWFGHEPIASVPATIWLTLGVVVAAAGAAYLPNRSARPGARTDVAAARPRLWRLAPLAAGMTSLITATALHGNRDGDANTVELAGFLGGAALAILGLPLALPVAVRVLGDLASRSRAPSVAIAGRGLQSEPSSTTRLVAAVLAALTVVTGGLCVLQSFWDLPQVHRAVLADTAGPQYGTIWVPSGDVAPSDAELARLAATPGVRAVVAMRDALVEDEPGACDRMEDPDSLCEFAFVGTCADLAALHGGAEGCRDDIVQLITDGTSDTSTSRWDGSTNAWIRANAYDGMTMPESTEIPSPTGQIVVPIDPDDPLQGFNGVSIFVPMRFTSLPVATVQVVMDGGPQVRSAVESEARGLSGEYMSEDLSELRRVEAYEATTWSVAGVMLATGLAGLAIAGADRVTERRRRLASLWAVGAPSGVLRRSQLWQALLPLAVGAPLAVAIGGLIGTAYLSLGGIIGRFPWNQTLVLLAIALTSAVITALVSQVGLGRRPSADLLRRE